jgi:hypothetical protein
VDTRDVPAKLFYLTYRYSIRRCAAKTPVAIEETCNILADTGRATAIPVEIHPIDALLFKTTWSRMIPTLVVLRIHTAAISFAEVAEVGRRPDRAASH